MDIKITDNKVIVNWLGGTSICDFDELVEQFKKADEQERKRLVIDFFSSELFRPVKEEKQVLKSRRLLSINNYCDAYGEYKNAFKGLNQLNPNYNYKFITTNKTEEDDFDLEDNPHWVVE